jgi:hypothetical protein
MTDRPILFSAEMVRAILNGSKTQTRRVMKPQPKPTPADYPGPAGHWWPSQKHKSMLGVEREMQKWKGLAGSACPYGDIGDQLWVRETCWAESVDQGGPLRRLDGDGIRYAADHAWLIIENTQEASEAWCKLCQYGGDDALDNQTNIGRRVPSIHMPRWASRITLRITDIRVERLQDISHADVLAEGLLSAEAERAHDVTMNPKRSFGNLWNQINGAGAWEANPWVWVMAFERVKP